MNKDWREKLKNLGAAIDSENNVSFAGKTTLSGDQTVDQRHDKLPLLVEMSQLAVVDITGNDAKSFLQDQLCNDLLLLSDNDIQINGYCTPKGRLLALFIVFPHEDGYRLLLPSDVCQAFTKRLQMFVMRAQVSINIREDLICSGLICDSMAMLDSVSLPALAQELPSAELQISNNEQMQIMRWHNAPTLLTAAAENHALQQRYLCIAEPAVMQTLWMNESINRGLWACWRWGDINAGIPSVYTTSSEQFIPQMLNMQLINALSFKKGCYPGQEIVARMQYLGKLKKHMRRLRVPGATTAPAPGELITTESNNNAGQVVDAVVDEDGLNLLAVVNIDIPTSELNVGGMTPVDAPIPYSLEAEGVQTNGLVKDSKNAS